MDIELHPRVKALDERRREAGLSLVDFAAFAGVSRTTLFRWTKGASPVLADLEAAEAALAAYVEAKVARLQSPAGAA